MRARVARRDCAWARRDHRLVVAGVTPHPGGPPPPDELLAAARTSPDTLIVDFRDDITNQALAARGYVDEPISRFSATDRMYRIRFPTPQEAEDAAAGCARTPWSSRSTTTPGQSVSRGRDTDGAARGRARVCERRPRNWRKVQASQRSCFRYQWHLQQIGLPAAWKLGQGRGSLVAVIDTGVSRVPDLAGTRFVPASTS